MMSTNTMPPTYATAVGYEWRACLQERDDDGEYTPDVSLWQDSREAAEENARKMAAAMRHSDAQFQADDPDWTPSAWECWVERRSVGPLERVVVVDQHVDVT